MTHVPGLPDPPKPFHRWRTNEDLGFDSLTLDYCLACGVRRFPRDDDDEAERVASGPCPQRRGWRHG
jgi:hypothetical protein